jgi:hypothetical protein
MKKLTIAVIVIFLVLLGAYAYHYHEMQLITDKSLALCDRIIFTNEFGKKIFQENHEDIVRQLSQKEVTLVEQKFSNIDIEIRQAKKIIVDKCPSLREECRQNLLKALDLINNASQSHLEILPLINKFQTENSDGIIRDLPKQQKDEPGRVSI